MNMQLVWLWIWFLVGSLVYMVKRAYYLVTGPNPVANSYTQFIQRCWAPLLVRFAVDSGIYWAMFTPGVGDKALAYFGWNNFSWAISMVTQFGVFALFFGMGIDSIVDFAISKIPGVSGWLPQMPPPLPTSAPTTTQMNAMMGPPPAKASGE